MAVQLSALYAGIFAVVGVMLPYWPVWLASRGLTPDQIGVIAGAAIWSKVIINPAVGHLADGLGRVRPLMFWIATLALTLYTVLSQLTSFWAILAVAVLATGLHGSLNPLTEAVTIRAVRNQGVDYGRARLWGSLAFIAVSMGLGPLLDRWGAAPVVWVIVGLLACVALTTLGLPDSPPETKAEPGGMRRLLTERGFLLFLGAGGLIQAGHATYYAFGSIRWLDAGLDGRTIGLLWAEGVVAEVFLFLYGKKVLARVPPLALMGLGALSGMIRWPLMALTADPWVMALTQILHAGTFGAAHLGAMYHLAKTIQPDLSGRAQALYSAICMGAIVGAAITLTGPLYARLGAGSYVIDGVWSALGGAFVVILVLVTRRERPPVIRVPGHGT
ncbi:MAG: MFS transporter [Rhodospirillum sp.]|nr:MFS transporter [Rhodospirillum sp.]MCF8488446.1 MFS transporter [Rhodospirillum sp.]MCF8499108.1 MFS transporter [Rhodospirillum sp.]